VAAADDPARIRFSPTILPPYMRRSKSIETLLPILYLKGISTGDFSEALSALLGKDAAGLSASTIGRLKDGWLDEHAAWAKRDLSTRRYVYIWADGIHLEARLEDEKQCILVIIGATPEGRKELVGFTDGARESVHDWRALLLKSDIAAEHYRTGVDLLLSAWPSAAEALDSAAAADPEFALAHAARARLHAIRAELTDARARIATATEVASKNGTERERSHVEILSLAINGQGAKAIEKTLTHLDTWPRDAVIFSLPLGAFGLFAFSGMANHDQARVDLCEKHARHYDANDWWFLTYRGWSHAENGSVKLGRDLSQRGFELREENANAAHALSHAMYEEGAGLAAEKFLGGWLPRYDRAGPLHGHIAWHSALVALERGDPERAIEIYLKDIQPSISLGMPINIVSDTSSFLWRLQAYGHQVPSGMWETAAAYAGSKAPNAGFAFMDVHMALIAAATADKEALERRVEALSGLVGQGKLPAGPVVPTICRGVMAFAEEDYAGCVRLLEPVAKDVVRVGGSGAQREVIEDTLLLALMRSGATEKARMLLDRRLHRRPSPRDARWRTLLAA
jgi:hypothetical protein